MEWIVIDKATRICVGVHRHPEAPKVDLQRYDMEQHPENTIDGPTEKYMRNAQGDIVKRPKADLIKEFPDERLNDVRQKLQTELASLQIDPGLTAFLRKIIERIV